MEIDVEALYKKYGPMVLRRCRQILKDEHKAMDAMQDTFVRLLRYKRRLTAKAPSSLLYTIATNICLNIIRKESKRAHTVEDEILYQIASGDEHETRIINRFTIERIFEPEKTSTKTMAVLHYVDGMTLEEVAKEVGLSVSGVRKRLRNLKERVQKLKGVL